MWQKFPKCALRQKLVTLILMAVTAVANPLSAMAASRIKDLVSIEGIRENQLVGYGLVVGLDGTGDSLRNAPYTEQSIVAMLERLGVNTRGTKMKGENVAAVMVTASLTPFARPGNRLDVSVSSIGDAENLRGGTLIVTPLKGADGEVYAVAQGSVQVSGFSAGGAASSVTQGVPTAGRIPNGGIVEKEVNYSMITKKKILLSLRDPDFTTSERIARAINDKMKTRAAMALDPATVMMIKPDNYSSNMVDLVTDIEQLYIQPDQKARVVVDERSGIIVIGNEVRVGEVAIAQGNLTIRVSETPQVSQPNPLGQGNTTVVPRTTVDVEDNAGKKFALLKPGVNLQDLVDGLNALGIGPRDMIAILQALKVSGALHAEIEVM